MVQAATLTKDSKNDAMAVLFAVRQHEKASAGVFAVMSGGGTAVCVVVSRLPPWPIRPV